MPIFNDEDNEELEHDVHSFVDKNDSSHVGLFEAGVLRCRCCDDRILPTTVTY